MTGDDTPFVEATYRALCAHGFADVTMQDIADETDRSKAALHYHYDGKEDLFRHFLEYLYEEFHETTADPPGDSPAERLLGLVRAVLSPDGDSDDQFTTAFLEIKAQAPYREGFREQLIRFDDRVRERVATLVAEGVEAGQFPPETDPDEVAAFVTTYLHGTWTRSVAAGGDVTAMRERLVGHLTQLTTSDARIDETVGLRDGSDTSASSIETADPAPTTDASASTTTDASASTTTDTESDDESEEVAE